MLHNKSSQPWLHSLFIDSLFIISPPLIILLIISLLPKQVKETDEISLISWVVLVLCIDVAHVYSTLYRTYFDKEFFSKNKKLLFNIPLLSFIASVVIYSINVLLFWRIMAYLAVFHFIRQQYGFIKIYSRKERLNKFQKIIETISIYNATLFPILYWHLHPEKIFHWFVENDFLYFKVPILENVLFGVYIIIALFHLLILLNNYHTDKIFNVPKFLLFLGTYLSWYFGIVYYNGDFTFTALNVIAHGIPYMALIWIYNKKKTSMGTNSLLQRISSPLRFFLFLLTLIAFAYIEEGLWDVLVWRDKESLFHVFWQLFNAPASLLLAIIVPLLAIPQITHYVIDGFIWKIKSKNNTSDFEL